MLLFQNNNKKHLGLCDSNIGSRSQSDPKNEQVDSPCPRSLMAAYPVLLTTMPLPTRELP